MKTLKIILTSLIAAFACTGIIYATTTVGSNISTGGTLSVTGASTLTGNTSITGTLGVTGNSTFTTASSTGIVKFFEINSDTGSISFGDDNLSTTGSLTITGSTTLEDLIIDATSTEAFLVRGGGDSRDVFVVDTTNLSVKTEHYGVQIGTLDLAGIDDTWDIVIHKGIGYMCDQGVGVVSLNMDNPEAPVQLDTLASANDNLCTGLEALGDVLYVADYNEGLISVDISDPTNLVQLDQEDPDALGQYYRLKIIGDILYIHGYLQGVFSYDISSSTNLTLLDQFDPGGNIREFCGQRGDYLFVTNDTGVYSINVSDPTNMSNTGGSQYTTVGGGNTFGCDMWGQYLITLSASYLEVIDISNPASMTRIGTPVLSPNGGNLLWAVQEMDGYVYVGESNNTPSYMHIYKTNNAADPSSWTLSQSWTISEPDLRDFVIWKDYLYTVGNSTGTTPRTNPVRLGISKINSARLSNITTGNITATNAQIEDQLFVDNNLTVGVGLAVGQGGIYTQGRLKLGGDISLNNKVITDVDGDVDITGNLDISGATIFYGDNFITDNSGTALFGSTNNLQFGAGTAGDYALSVDADDDSSITYSDPTTANNDEYWTLEKPLVVDDDDTEALLIRKNGDGGDLFTADTANMAVTVNGFFGFGSATEVTIDTDGTIVATGTYHTIDTFGDAATDSLETISGGSTGDIIILQSADSGRDTTLQHFLGGTDNLFLSGTTSFTLSTTRDKIMLINNGGYWYEISRSTN